MKNVSRALSVMFILIALYFVIGQIVLPFDSPRMGEEYSRLDRNNWYIVNDDGSRTPFEVPGVVDGDVIIETVLPDPIPDEASALCFYGGDMQAYVDGELRAERKTQTYRFFGTQVAECYVLAPIDKSDAGKTLSIKLYYCSGKVYDVYIGTGLGILLDLLSQYGLELLIGAVILSMGIICYIASIVYRIKFKKYLEMQHLSLGIIFGTIWVLSNSIFRQLYTSNMSVIGNTTFMMITIVPIPFLIFINAAQQGRYEKILTIAGILEIVDFVVVMTLFVTGIASLDKMFLAMAGCMLVSIGILSYTLIMEIKNHKTENYRYIAVGLVVMSVAAIIEVVVYLFLYDTVFSGMPLAIGLLAFLICAMLHTIKQLIRLTSDKIEADASNKAKGEFLAQMSHEIRTPLNGILGMDEMILRESKDEDIRKYANNIKGAGNTLLAIINDILDLSKVESGKLEIVTDDYKVIGVINDVVNMTRPKAAAKGLNYIFSVDEKIPRELHGDEVRIRQIALNIINNALKYTKKGEVAVDFSYSDGMFKLRVQDTGIGIKEEDLDKLFDSFQRLDEKKNKHIEGTGLGLYITRQLVTMMGGNIDVQSVYGQGSTFTVIIPQRVVDDKPLGDYQAAIDENASANDSFETTLIAPKARVLFVDDNEVNLEVISELLKTTKMSIDLVCSGKECIEEVGKRKYDVIYLDQMMPEMDGEMTFNEMKRLDILQDTPVIALTADAVVGAKEHYLAMGFTDYLSKPILYEALEHSLKSYIPKEKQIRKAVAEQVIEDMNSIEVEEENKETVLIIGSDASKVQKQKKLLADRFKCVCVVGEEKANQYLSKHKPDMIMRIND